MKQNPENFAVESTPVLDFNKHGFKNHSEQGFGPAGIWDSDRTEVYADIDESDAMASLIGKNGSIYPITTFPYIIGRGNECDLVMQGKGISRKHAEIVFQSGRFVVNDLESLNGIKVNGYKVARVILEENDVIKLGEVSLTFRSGDAAAGGLGESGAAATGTDNTFGASPVKKVLSFVFALLAVGLVAASGYVYLQKNQSSAVASKPAVASTTAPSATAAKPANSYHSQPSVNSQPPAAVTAPASIGQSPQNASLPPPASAIAPPPSLAMAPKTSMPASKAPEPAKTVSQPTAPVAAKPVAKLAPAPSPKPAPAPKQPTINLNSQAEASTITAQNLYIQGQAKDALDELKKYIGNAAVSSTYQSQVKQTYNNLESLYGQFMDGQKAFSAGDKDRAFSIWTQFMAREQTTLGGQKSTYSRSIANKVMDEYVERGNQASNQGDYHQAYEYWKKALEIGDSVSARIALDNLDNKARQLYRQALRLEYVNTKKAREMWTEVTQLLPAGTEYNTKASAKLAWYEKWGN